MDGEDSLVDAPVKYDMTATNLVFRRSEDTGDWVTGVAYHVRLGGFLPAGGHWEDGESLAETALRETVEELGCRTLIIPGPSSMLAPAGYPHPVCPVPWWIIDCRASADSHTPGPHREGSNPARPPGTQQPLLSPARSPNWRREHRPGRPRRQQCI
ncbi:NUDIX domain-containing protein [Nonomuraea sp. NPDC049480]|uniref:NUDIX domain-containing protein n=1 Tax=Nonomuraea sp. NPDC049480 TaxID=3364353 RepID=UPI00378BF0F6